MPPYIELYLILLQDNCKNMYFKHFLMFVGRNLQEREEAAEFLILHQIPSLVRYILHQAYINKVKGIFLTLSTGSND